MNRISDLQVRYPGAAIDAVREFDLPFDKGEVIVIFGPNGSGKTTGLKAIAGILNARSIESTVEPRHFAYLHQDPFMLHRKVGANIAYGLADRSLSREAIEERVRMVARRCEVEEILSRRATRLSGGQRQRVALARALALDRPVLLLDEPTANLDAASRATVARIVREESRRGRTVIIATHDTGFALALGHTFYRMQEGALEVSRVNIIRGSAAETEEEISAVALPGGSRIYGSADGPLPPGSRARAVFRPEDVVLSLREVASSALNTIPLEVMRIEESPRGTVMVRLEHPSERALDVYAEVTHRSLRDMGIEAGFSLVGSIKASSVTLYPEE